MLTVEADPKALAGLVSDLDRLARALPDEDDRKGMRGEIRAAAVDAAEAVVAEAQKLVPVGKHRTVVARDGTRVSITPGRLRKSIKASVDPFRGRVSVVAGDRAKRQDVGTATAYRRPYWAGWVNYGHDQYVGGAKGRLRVRSRALRGTRSGTGRRVGRVKGSLFMNRAMDNQASNARRIMQRGLDDVIRKYNRKFEGL